MVDLLADDGVYAGAHILGIKYTLVNVGIYFAQKTGTWPPNEVGTTQPSFGFFGPEIECPDGLSVQCGTGTDTN